MSTDQIQTDITTFLNTIEWIAVIGLASVLFRIVYIVYKEKIL